MKNRILFFAWIFIAFHAVLFVTSCGKKSAWPDITYTVFTAEDFPGGKLYAGQKDGILYAVVVGDFNGIDGHVILTHDCTSEQFEYAMSKVGNLGGEKLGTVDEILFDRKKYPDQSIYITWVLSYDERHELWKTLGLETDEDEGE